MAKTKSKNTERDVDEDLLGSDDNYGEAGHNSGDEDADDDTTMDVGGVAGKRLNSFLDRIERLEEEKAGLAQDIKEIYAEAKAVGFDTKTMRKIYKLRKMETDKRREEEELLDLYKAAIGLE